MADQTNNQPPPDWAHDWGRIPYNPNAERAAFNFSNSGPAPMIPRGPFVGAAPSGRPDTGGWQHEVELGPAPGIDLIDAMCINADQRERQQAQPTELTQMMQAMAAMQTTQTQMVTALAALVLRMEDKPKRRGRKPKSEAKP
jgi:hypothetical protein